MRKIDGYVYDKMSPAWLKKIIKDNEYKWQNFSDEELMNKGYK